MKFKCIFCNKCTLSKTVDVLDKNETSDQTIYTSRTSLLQIISLVGCYMIMIDVGAQVAWTSPSLPFLMSNNSHIHVSFSEGSWLVSLESLFSVFGSLIHPLIVDRIGRKYTFLTFGLMQVSAWILINLAKNYTFLYIARALAGIGYFGSTTVATVYVAEISKKSVRGVLILLLKICVNFGSFLMATVGAFLTYDTANLVMMLLAISAIIMLLFSSETPYFCLMKGHDNEAVKTLVKLSGVRKSELVMTDIETMKKTIAENDKFETNNIRELFVERGSRKALIITIVGAIIMAFSGSDVIRSYAEELLSYSSFSFPPKYGVMVLMATQIFGGLLSSQFIDRWGRRPAFLLSGILSALSLGAVGLFYFLQMFLEFDTSSFTWLPLVGLIFFMFTCNMGITVIVYVYSGELFPLRVKGIALMLIGTAAAFFDFAASMSLPVLKSVGGLYTAFWFFAFFCIAGPLIIWFAMPETKGKHLEEVSMLKSEQKTSKEK